MKQNSNIVKLVELLIANKEKNANIYLNDDKEISVLSINKDDTDIYIKGIMNSSYFIYSIGFNIAKYFTFLSQESSFNNISRMELECVLDRILNKTPNYKMVEHNLQNLLEDGITEYYTGISLSKSKLENIGIKREIDIFYTLQKNLWKEIYRTTFYIDNIIVFIYHNPISILSSYCIIKDKQYEVPINSESDLFELLLSKRVNI